jgi:DNA-binding transcriptional MocR family regulator
MRDDNLPLDSSTEKNDIEWSNYFSVAQKRAKPSAVRELLKLTNRPNVLSFAGGVPDPCLLPLRELESCMSTVKKAYGATPFQYGVSEGAQPLRDQLALLAQRRGRPTESENILVTHGSQQAISLLADLFMDAGDPIVVTRPCYLGALQVFTRHDPEFLEVSSDTEGPILDELEKHLKRGPKFFYLVSAFSNPTGESLSLARAKAIIELCRRYRVPILEDAAYQELFYEESPVSLRKLEADMLGEAGQNYDTHGQVIYLGTLSKVLSPGLRIGWIEGPRKIIHATTSFKQAHDLHTNMLGQYVAAEFLKSFAEESWSGIRSAYRIRRDAAITAVTTLLKGHVVSANEPTGGFFLWLELDPNRDTAKLLRHALENHGVAYVPGAPFFAVAPPSHFLRLSFSNLSPEAIEEGVRRIAKAFERT